ncbi:phosphoribosylamine--glycine ligase [Ilyomonas limi]|uniref:Phosphoribosylamine--glycine ligase n=1 Tax=Ilyomonas limi TaxID=2575867 RepID=A0A4U3L9D1_9BACT|nr:phosphoribosylamine--glycine ligase [Ilyomonas limi]TKK71921.1 phosphoribosylamine--glycine ligase [Ilyomonas limi]
MNILLLGSGGREHALAWKMVQSSRCTKLFIAPGNAGTAQCGINVSINSNDFNAISTFCINEKIDLLVVGPEEPLVKGIYDFFQQPDTWKGMVIGPSAAAAQLEGSKAFSKKFMQRHHIPTAAYAEFDESNFELGKKYIQRHSLPIVLKADGLAAGKGVVICNTVEEAQQVFEEMIVHKQFGEASAKVVIEQFLSGVEVSVFVITDGSEYKIIGHAKDYKRIGEGDTGLNTGGMGCVSPVPFVTEEFMQKVEQHIIQPTIKGIKEESLTYKGFIFFGLINVNDEPFVIEYNCRMGDPETEVVMPRLKNDIVELFEAMYYSRLQNITIKTDERACCTVVAVSGGYPGDYKKGKPIYFGERYNNKETIIFHAGTQQKGDEVITNGGRVLAITSFGNTISEAVEKSKKVLETIQFDGMYYRKDIGYEFE